jgi:hypothetical protein
MVIDPYIFADELAAWLASECTPALRYADTPRALWLIQAVEGDAAADPYTVLTPHAAELQQIGLPRIGVQLRTTGEDAEASAQAAAVFASLLDDDGRPRQQVSLPSHKVIAFAGLRPPAPIGRDERRRLQVVSNFDVEFVRVA